MIEYQWSIRIYIPSTFKNNQTGNSDIRRQDGKEGQMCNCEWKKWMTTIHKTAVLRKSPCSRETFSQFFFLSKLLVEFRFRGDYFFPILSFSFFVFIFIYIFCSKSIFYRFKLPCFVSEVYMVHSWLYNCLNFHLLYRWISASGYV